MLLELIDYSVILWFLTPLQNVEQTLNSPRYEKVVFIPNHARTIGKETAKKTIEKLETLGKEIKEPCQEETRERCR